MVQLTREQLDALHEAGNQTALLEAEINKAERAGLDVADLRAQLAKVEKVRKGLLEIYGGYTRRASIG